MVELLRRSSGSVLAYLREARREMQKVNWPTRQEVTRMTLTVLLFSAIVALVLGGFDFVFDRFILYILPGPTTPSL